MCGVFDRSESAQPNAIPASIGHAVARLCVIGDVFALAALAASHLWFVYGR